MAQQVDSINFKSITKDEQVQQKANVLGNEYDEIMEMCEDESPESDLEELHCVMDMLFDDDFLHLIG